HLGNYMIYYLGFTPDFMGYIEGLALILGMFTVIPTTRLINKGVYTSTVAVAVVFNIAGLLILGLFVRPDTVNTATIFNPVMVIGILFIGIGYVTFLQTVSVWAKGLYPQEAKGQFEGIRILFFVLIPMIIAPLVSNPIIKASGEITNDYGLKEYLPNETLFLVAAGVSLIIYVPLFFAAKYRKKINKE
nr:MFS transporter [Lachnospiraceae bacterium]